ncbi:MULTISPECIES: hypothetical protein [Streptomyces]|uniref:hypothetical protein n=1 Tax=Streptomyces TaxID=1883 RepID=UPI001317082B|nr:MULTISPECIES: hypothetical protein [Streptomyces]QGZ47321.1 hypothetical protein GPZ77_01880 [Streptomyces sp. QHH-9511]GGT80208.1 hypothetical protein GCM10010272_25610 [Streptomyces lateritius]
MGHVLARLAGFGMTLTPRRPYSFERASDTPPAVRVTTGEGETARIACVTAVTGPPRVELTNARDVDDVVDVQPGPAEPHWRIETSAYALAWPAGFTVESPPADDFSPFLLWGPDDALLHVQGPVDRERIPPPPQLAGPGQRLVDHRADPAFEAVELAYRHEGDEWRQWHHLVALDEKQALVVTSQCPARHAELVRSAAETVARSLTTSPAHGASPPEAGREVTAEEHE